VTAHFNVPTGGGQNRGHHAQCRGLAGAVGTQQTDYLATADVQIQMINGKFTVDQHATCAAVLKMPTFSEVSEMAALSRLMGGYHIRTDNEVGVVMGRQVSEHIWPRMKALFEGKSMAAAAPMKVEKIRKKSVMVKGF